MSDFFWDRPVLLLYMMKEKHHFFSRISWIAYVGFFWFILIVMILFRTWLFIIFSWFLIFFIMFFLDKLIHHRKIQSSPTGKLTWWVCFVSISVSPLPESDVFVLVPFFGGITIVQKRIKYYVEKYLLYFWSIFTMRCSVIKWSREKKNRESRRKNSYIQIKQRHDE